MNTIKIEYKLKNDFVKLSELIIQKKLIFI